MIIRALIYCIGVFVLTGIIALIVAGIIKLLYKSIHRNPVKNNQAQTEDKNPQAKPAA